MSKLPATSCSFLPAVPGMVSVSCVPNCLAPGRRWEGTAPALRTLASIKAEVCRMARVPGFWSAGGTMALNGVVVPASLWDKVTAKPGDRIAFVAAPTGKVGNILLKVVAAVAMIAGAIMTGGAAMWSPTWWAGVGFLVGGTALSMTADLICPIPTPSIGTSDSKATSPTYSLNASSNNMRYGQPIPRIYGTYKVPPVRILDDYTELSGQDEYLNFLSVIGYGPLEISDLRIGGNPLDNFSGVTTQMTQGWEAGEETDLTPKVVYQSSFQVKLTGRDSNGNVTDADTWWVTRSLDEEVDRLSLDLQAPQGLYKMDDNAKKHALNVVVQAQIRPQGGEWLELASRVDIPAQTVTFDEASDFFGYVVMQNGAISLSKERKGVVLGTLNPVFVLMGKDMFQPLEALAEYHFSYEKAGNSITFRGGWYEFVGELTLEGNAAEPSMAVRSSYSWDVRPLGHQKYDVRVRLKEAESTDSKYMQAVYFTALRGFDNNAATDNGKLPLAKLAMRIKASNQLSGSLPVVTCLATSIIRDWDGSAWVKRATRNPASAFLDVLTGVANERRKSDDQIDWQSLQEWHEWCNKYGYTCDLVFDQQTSVWDALAQIAAVGRGSAALMGGLWGAVWSRRQDGAPKGHITARNSRDFSSRKTYREPIHGLHVTFNDAENDYEETVIDVYAPGYNRNNASLFEGIDLAGITNRKQAAYMGQFRLNQLLYLPEEYSVTMPLEYMRLRKADKVRVVRPEVLYGIGAAILVDWEEDASGAVTALRWDSQLPMNAGERYMAVVRLSSGEEFAVTGTSEDGLNFVLDIPAVPTFELKAMNLVMVGTVQEVGRECLVVEVKPQGNLTATVTMQDYIPELYENDGGSVPPYDAHTTLPGNVGRALKTPTITLVRSDEWALEAKADGLLPRLYVSWKFNDASTHARVEYRRVEAGNPGAWTMASTVEGDFVFIPGVEEGYRIEAGKVVSNGIRYDVRVQAVNPVTGRASAWAEQTGHAVIGRTTPPPAVEGLTLAVQNPEGILASWTAVRTKDFAKYRVEGAVVAESAVESVMLKPYGKSGQLAQRVYAEDVLGLRSTSALEATVEVLPPAMPAPMYTVEANRGTEVNWADCKTTWSISHYEVEDLWAATSTTYTDPRFGVSPRPLGNAYRYLITAVDVFGNRGPVADFAASLGAMPAPVPATKVDGTQVVVSWAEVAAPFAVDVYEVQTQDGVLLGKVKGTELRFEAPKAGTHGYKVRGIDIAGNIGPWGECALVLTAPQAPAVTVTLGEDKASIALNWTMPQADLPVVAFDVVRQWDVMRDDGVVETHEEDYGRHDVQALSVPAISVGEHGFLVRAVDNSGNIGPWGSADFTVRAPGAVTPYDCRAVYNNVMLYFTEPASTMFKVREYLVHEVEGDYAAVVGTVDALFFAEVRNSAGTYTYGITPVDIAGNLGPRATVDVKVDSPPNLVLLHEWESTFNGQRTNLILDGHGSMLGPVPASETWAENISRSTSELGVGSSGLTWEQKVQGGMATWLSPASGVATYVETQDVGEVLAAPTIDVTVTQKALEGNPTMTCRIEVSKDGSEWRTAAENTTNVTTENVRFVRISLTWAGGLVQVQSMYVSMNVKSVEDSGTVMCLAADCLDASGDFLPDEVFGTRVDFNVAFVDVENDVEAKPVSADSGLNPLVVFTEGAASYPTGFRVALLDSSGQPVDGEVFWYAKGR